MVRSVFVERVADGEVLMCMPAFHLPLRLLVREVMRGWWLSLWRKK